MNADWEKQILDTWNINNRINLYMLDAIAKDALSDVSASKGRSVAEQFAHIHNVRLMWLKSAGPELMAGLEKIENENAPDKKLLERSLKDSGTAIEKLLQKGLAEGRIKGFKPHPMAFLGYILAHDAQHRGQIALALKQSKHPLDKKVAYGIWEWGVR